MLGDWGDQGAGERDGGGGGEAEGDAGRGWEADDVGENKYAVVILNISCFSQSDFLTTSAAGNQFPSMEEKVEMDLRSVYVGNVSGSY